MKIAIVGSEFNKTITEKLVEGAKKILDEKSVENKSYWVPGAYELPLACKWLLKKYDAVVAVGTIIKGETPHFDHVSNVASLGIADVSKESEKPIGFGVITANTVDQAAARSGDDENNLGYKAAIAVLKMLQFKQEV